MSRTTAGRALLDELAGRAMDFGTVLDHAAWAEALDAIEREAAEQERERIREAVTAYDYWATRDVNDHMAAPEEMQADILAILAEPSE